MTYISRKERIIVPRWLDECDAEYKLRASRKRSEGRLKRHISCDDLRAWANDNHIKNEHFLDLMSDGEATGTNRVRLYGRYIPVPVLIKLVQSVTDGDLIKEESDAEEIEVEENIPQNNESDNEPENENSEIEKRENEFYSAPKSRTASLAVGDNKADKNQKKRAEKLTLDDNKIGQIRKKRAESLSKGSSKARQIQRKRAGSLSLKDNTPESFGYKTEELTADNEADDSVYYNKEASNEAIDDSETIDPDDLSMEKKFLKCAALLGKAIGKLERIDNIASLAIEEAENAENEEIRMNMDQSKSDSSFCSDNHELPSDMQSRINTQRARDSEKYMELLRKISCLRQKLRKIQECRLKINEQMRVQREAKYCSNHQVTELYNRREQAKIKRLHRKLEKLISTKGKLLSELTDAVSCLNKLKRSASRSRSTLYCKRNSSRMSTDEDENLHLREPVSCACGCQCSDNNLGSSESDKLEFSDSVLSETYGNENSFQQQKDSILNYPSKETEKEVSQKNSPEMNSEDNYYHPTNHQNYKEQANNSINTDPSPIQFPSFHDSKNQLPTSLNSKKFESPSSPTGNRSTKSKSPYSPAGHGSTKSKSPSSPTGRKSTQSKSPIGSRNLRIMTLEAPNNVGSSATFSKADNEVNKETRPQKKSKFKFVCPESPNKNKYNSEDLEYYQSKNAEQLSRQTKKKRNASISYPDETLNYNSNPSFYKPVQNNKKSMHPVKIKRPNTSPLEKTLRQDYVNKTPARKIRSETTMKEIEKALRNYDERLNGLEALESKIEKLREKLSESNRKKHELLIERDEGKEQKAAEREKSSREITKLCSENWELKLQVQKLAAKSDVQYKKLQSLKSNKKKMKELENEAEDLKKELLEYQDSFQDQRKCISMLESVVAVQRTEIEKLMNLIKKLTTMDRLNCCVDRKNIQRSRSYSPESRRSKRTYCRPKINRHNASSDEDCSIICCEDYYPQHEMRRNHQKNFDRRFCSPESSKKLGRCVN